MLSPQGGKIDDQTVPVGMSEFRLPLGVDQESEGVPGQSVALEAFLDRVDDPVVLNAQFRVSSRLRPSILSLRRWGQDLDNDERRAFDAALRYVTSRMQITDRIDGTRSFPLRNSLASLPHNAGRAGATGRARPRLPIS